MQRAVWYFIESHENTMLEFLFCYLKKMGMQNKYLWYFFHFCLIIILY